MGIDFAALDTGQRIRQSLDRVEQLAGGEQLTELMDLADVLRKSVEELEQRLNTARRTAWVAVPIAWRLVQVGDVIVGKDGTLIQVIDGGNGKDWLEISDQAGDRQIRTTDLDRPVPVLRRPTADALDILTRQLGAQVK